MKHSIIVNHNNDDLYDSVGVTAQELSDLTKTIGKKIQNDELPKPSNMLQWLADNGTEEQILVLASMQIMDVLKTAMSKNPL